MITSRVSSGLTFVGRIPWSARIPRDPLYAKRTNSPVPNRPTGTSAADQGVRPTQRKPPRTSGDFQSQAQPADLAR
jgi:hypothetical protein